MKVYYLSLAFFNYFKYPYIPNWISCLQGFGCN